MDNFDLKKYLVENKVTTNSRMIKENEENFSVELLVPTIYRNGETGELAKTPAAFGARSELKHMDITNYSDGEELIEWVFDGSLEKAKYFEKEYPGLFKIVGGSEREDGDSTAKIEDFVYSHPEYEELTPEELNAKIQEYKEEWESVSDNYSNIEDYFDEIENRGDFL